jgi:hypothetical protein
MFIASQNYTLKSIEMNLLRVGGTPTGNITADIYAVDPQSSSGKPTGSPIGSTGTRLASDIGTADYVWEYFDIEDGIALTAGTYYAIVIKYPGAGSPNFLRVGETLAQGAQKNFFTFNSGGSWFTYTDSTLFKTYDVTVGPPSGVQLTPYNTNKRAVMVCNNVVWYEDI